VQAANTIGKKTPNYLKNSTGPQREMSMNTSRPPTSLSAKSFPNIAIPSYSIPRKPYLLLLQTLKTIILKPVHWLADVTHRMRHPGVPKVRQMKQRKQGMLDDEV
jgi:hypothetical protein